MDPFNAADVVFDEAVVNVSDVTFGEVKVHHRATAVTKYISLRSPTGSPAGVGTFFYRMNAESTIDLAFAYALGDSDSGENLGLSSTWPAVDPLGYEIGQLTGETDVTQFVHIDLAAVDPGESGRAPEFLRITVSVDGTPSVDFRLMA